MAEEEKIYRIKTKQTTRASWYLMGCKSKDSLYFKKRFIKQKLGPKFNLVFEGQPRNLKPYLAEQFLDEHPTIGSFKARGWMNYLNISENKACTDVIHSFKTALLLFRRLYPDESVEWILVFSVPKEEILF